MPTAAHTVITQSGNKVSPIFACDTIEIEDVAVGLGRAARFAGHTREWYSVLHHSVVCYNMVEHEGGDAVDMLSALCHDFHEAFTGDVPSPFKSKQMAAFQDKLDAIIFRDLRIPFRYSKFLKNIDSLSAIAEASAIGPPGWVEEVYGHDDVDIDHYNIVKDVVENWNATHTGMGSDSVHRFISLFHYARDAAHYELGWE
jgi:hypothetical protein